MMSTDTDLHEAITAALGALLVDKDVASVDVVEGGLPEVVRRGRRERLQVLVEGPLFQLLRERGATENVLTQRLPGGAVVVAAPLRDGRIAVSVRRGAPTDVQLVHLVEEGIVPAGVEQELLAAVWQGTGVVVLGPARAARHRLAVGIVRAMAGHLRVIALGEDVPAGAWPAPLVEHVVDRARVACALGADVVFALDVSADDAVALARAALPVPLVLGVAVSAMESLLAALDGTSIRALCGVAAVVAYDGEGRPRLVELHGDTGAAAVDNGPVITPVTEPVPSTPLLPTPISMPTSPTKSMRSTSLVLPSPSMPIVMARLSDSDAPPADWASVDIEDDPGWELGNLDATPVSLAPAAPGSFDAALKAAATRPTFSPRPPPMHPQASTLRGTGGLTLEPPGGSSNSDSDDQ